MTGMTPPMIAAQEQRLTRLAELARIPRRLQTGQEMTAVDFLIRMVRRDATLNDGTFRRIK